MNQRRRGPSDAARLTKAVDRFEIKCAVAKGWINEEIWTDASGAMVKYNLAFINHRLYAGDNGRVLGYDTGHGYAHRHYCGRTEKTKLSAELAVKQFYKEIEYLRGLKRL
jgi:hypothetical protein